MWWPLPWPGRRSLARNRKHLTVGFHPSTMSAMKEKTKSVLYLMIRILASALLLGLLLSRVDLSNLTRLFSSVRPLPLVLGFLAWLGVLLLSNERWRRLLSAQEIQVPFLRLLVIYMISFFFNNFLPAALGMDITRTVYIAKDSQTRR